MKKIILFLGLWLTATVAFSQITTQPDTEVPKVENKSKPKIPSNDKFFKRENLAVGGGFGLGIGNRFVSVSVAPEVGYFLVPSRLLLGGRFYYNYYKDSYYDVKSHLYGGGPYMRGYIYKGLFAQAEYELSSVEIFYVDNFGNVSGSARQTYNAFLVGGGYHHNFDAGVGFYISILYNVLQNTDFIYPNPSIRTGITYSFGGR
jgi:hypothetical protein